MWLASAERKWTLLFKPLLLRSSASALLLNKHLQFILSFEEIYEFLHWCGFGFFFVGFFFGFFFFSFLICLNTISPSAPYKIQGICEMCMQRENFNCVSLSFLIEITSLLVPVVSWHAKWSRYMCLMYCLLVVCKVLYLCNALAVQVQNQSLFLAAFRGHFNAIWVTHPKAV